MFIAECDNCVHILIDDVEALNAEMSGLTANLEGVSAGVSAHNRLKKINETVFEYRVRGSYLMLSCLKLGYSYFYAPATITCGTRS